MSAPAPADTASHPAPAHSSKSTGWLALGALGVVFGDIGTSPIYALRDAVALAGADGLQREEVIGVLSLALWSLIIVVTIKYVIFLMRADNDGEGGVLALMALAQRAVRKRSTLVLVLGGAGASLFYGDGIITPALSVLSAVEGLQTVPSIAPYVPQPVVVMASLAILVGLFALQARGTAGVAKLFGPICLIWFFALAGLGATHLLDDPGVLVAFLPSHAVGFLIGHGFGGLFVVGAVFLTVTGAEALTADMGHFGRRPIRIGWFVVVFPALALNYLGQAAFILKGLAAMDAAHKPFASANWFFLMAPDAWRAPLVVLAMLATIIASQAVITGAFSLTQQAIQLGLMPRMQIRFTSATQAGQVYVPLVNTLLFIGVVTLVLFFGSSSAMAAAYGISVTGTMVVTTCLAFIVVVRGWKWRLPIAIALIAPLLAIDLGFFGANILRVVQGGWVPLLVAALIGVVLATWHKGRRLLGLSLSGEGLRLVDLARDLAASPPPIVPGMAVFLSPPVTLAPVALLNNLKHNKILHERNLVVTSATANVPSVPEAERVRAERIDARFTRLVLHYGFMDRPDVPATLAQWTAENGMAFNPMTVSYFISRPAVRPSPDGGLPYWQDLLFIFLQRNAANPTAFFQVPPNRVVEMGSQIIV